jgi:DNA-binding transcriptional regulator/RsmH inhibitor MraZ
MHTDKIDKIEIDSIGRLCITPHIKEFTLIYREAKEVHWDTTHKFLYSPPPREWSYLDWYKHIIGVVKECNCILELTDDTEWINVPQPLKTDICTLQS